MDYNQLTVGSTWQVTHPGNVQFYIKVIESPNLWELKEYNLKGYVLITGTLVSTDEPIYLNGFSLGLGSEISIEPISPNIYQFWRNMCTRA
jgi:hypothetical protein